MKLHSDAGKTYQGEEKLLKDGDGTEYLSQLGVKNNSKILASRVSLDQGKSIKEESLAEKELFQRLKLIEEKGAALHQSNRLRQELELLRRDISKGCSGGVSFMFVIILGLLVVVLGYILKN